MAWGIRKSYKLGLFRLNFSKSAVGISFRAGPISQSINSRKRGRTSFTVPNTGVFYRKQEQFHSANHNR